MVVKLCHPYILNFRTMFACFIGELKLFHRIATFLIIGPYKYSYLRMSFLLINIYGSSMQ